MSTFTLPQAKSFLSSYSSASAAANTIVVAKQRSLADASNVYKQLTLSNASASQLQAQMAIVSSLQSDLTSAISTVKDLSASKTLAQTVVNSAVLTTVTGPSGPTGSSPTGSSTVGSTNPFTAVTGPTGPAGLSASVPFDTVATSGSTKALTSGGAYIALSSVSITPSMAIATTDTTVQALYHFDGTDGATSGPGLTFGTSTVTCYNGACLTTSGSRFGTACLDCTGGVGTAYAYVPVLGGFGISTTGTAFTMEFWFKLKSYTTAPFFRGAYPYVAYDNANQRLVVTSAGMTEPQAFAPASLALNTWYHWAFSKSSNGSVYCYLNGINVCQAGNINLSNYLSNTILGNCPAYYDELRVLVGVDRYPGGVTFTPPTAPFSEILNVPAVVVGTSSSATDSTVSALYHFDGANGATSGAGLTFGTSTITCNNGACLTTSTLRFGTACLDCTSNSNAYVDIPNPYLSGIPTNGSAFTVEFWFKFKTYPTQMFFYCGNQKLYYYDNISTFQTTYYNNGISNYNVTRKLELNRWYHVAFSKSSTANDYLYLYLDGVKYGSVQNVGTNYCINPFNLLAGQGAVYYDEFRFSVGVDRYPGGKTFTCPNAPFTSTALTPSFPQTSAKGQTWTDGAGLYTCTNGGTSGAGTWKQQSLYPNYFV